MALYAIGDLHLSFGSDKPMDVFGSRWDRHTEKLQESFSALEAEDVCVICGDLSWSMSLDAAAEDFQFIHRLGGKKIILKGNHDYWWSTASKLETFFRQQEIDSIRVLHNNCILYGDIALCGTRGWFYEEEKGGAHDKKIMDREIGRLETSLKAAGGREIYCFLHYPPIYSGYECREILELLRSYGVKECCYGHLHGHSHKKAVQGQVGGVNYRLVSGDYLNFQPIKLRN